MADPETEARAAGYSWDEISDHTNAATLAATDEGYTQDEINQHLGFDPVGLPERALSQWAYAQANNPKILTDLTAPEPQLDLSATGSTASDYRHAILNGEVTGPQDFAEHYAAAALQAAHDVHGADDTNPVAVDDRQAAAAMAVTNLVAQMPGRRDLIDSSLNLVSDPNDPQHDMVREGLMNHWVETGQDPVDTSIKASNNGDLYDRVTAPYQTGLSPIGSIFPSLEDLSQPNRDAIEKFHFVPGEELPDSKSVSEALENLAVDVGSVAALELGGRYIVAPLVKAAYIKFGELPGYIRNLTKGVEVPVMDPTAEPGSAVTMTPVAEAYKPIKPAAREPAVEGTTERPFVETATPVEKIEALVQDNPEAKLSFTDLAKDEDPATQELAAGYDTAVESRRDFLSVVKDLLTDESGIGKAIDPKTREAKILGKNAAEEMIRRNAIGAVTQSVEAHAFAMEKYQRTLQPFIKAFEAKLYGDSPVEAFDTELGKVFDAIEGHGTIAPDHPLAPYVAERAAQNDLLVKEIEARVASGNLSQFSAREYYLKHIYENADEISGRYGKQGDSGALRARTFPTYREAVEDGYQMKYTNPIDIDRASQDAMRKLIAWTDIQAEAKDSNWIYSSTERPAANGRNEAGDYKLTGINSSKTIGVSTEENPLGTVTHTLYSRPGFATIYNNTVGYDNYNIANSKVRSIEESMLAAKNFSTYFKLILPVYHQINIIKQAWGSALGNVVQEFAHAEIGRGMWDLAKVPTAPIEYVVKGLANRKMYRQMENDPAMQAAVDAGYTLPSKLLSTYRTGNTPTLVQSIVRGSLMNELRADVRQAGSGEGWTLAGNVANLPFREAGRLATTATSAFWAHEIPLIKSAATMQRIQTFLRQNPTATGDFVKLNVRQIVENVEDRFGEYNMNNLYWPQMAKRIMNQIALSTTWTYGTVHATMAALGWRIGRGMEWNPHALFNLSGQLAVVAATNALWGLAIDGKMPDSAMDYLMPFASARGLARVLLPGEEKEYYDWMKIAMNAYSVGKDEGGWAGAHEFFKGLGGYATGKIAPIWQAALGWMFGEEDAVGHRINEQPGGPAEYLKNTFYPAFMQNWDKNAAVDVSPLMSAAGIRPAAKIFQGWDAYRDQQQGLHNKWTAQELRRYMLEHPSAIPLTPGGATRYVRPTPIAPAIPRSAPPTRYVRPQR